MGSLECDKRHLDEDIEESNWEWTNLPLNKENIKTLLGRALEIAVKFFFTNFAYTFGGELFLQIFGGPIGARIEMQQWREDHSKSLKKSKPERTPKQNICG